MDKYYYIPIQNNNILLDFINQFALDNNLEVVTNHVNLSYQPTKNTIVYNSLRDDRTIIYISTIKILGELLAKSLPLLSCLYYDETMDIDINYFKSVLMTFDGVLEFNDKETYLEYLNNLNQK